MNLIKRKLWQGERKNRKYFILKGSRLPALLFFLQALITIPLQAQMAEEDTVKTETSAQPLLDSQVQYSNTVIAGEFIPGKGFLIAKNPMASLNIGIYGMARYLNQLPGISDQQWTNHLGDTLNFTGRQDFYWHRVMIWFTGYAGTPKLTYMATVWTVFTTQQSLVYGNLTYHFNKHFNLGMGITPNLCVRSLQGAFPMFSSTDRTMAEDMIRGGFTNGLFLNGIITPKLRYSLVLGNNLSQLGITAAKMTRYLSQSASLSWMPTTGEFGPRGGNGDFENHQKVATRFGASYCYSRENRFNNIGQPSPDNTQVRMSDGVLFFETGALAPGVTVEEAAYNLVCIDAGMKYKGLAIHAEVYHRTLSKMDTDGPVPMKTIVDRGYMFQVMHMVIKNRLCVYGVVSGLQDQFRRNPYEYGGGINLYPAKSRTWRVNLQMMNVYKCAAGGTFGLYGAGQTGGTITFGTDILL